MPTTILSGADDQLRRRVEARLRDSVEVLVVEDVSVGPELKTALDGAAALVHLGGSVAETRALLEVAGDAGVGHVVLLSSATVYGAWPDNPVPLTEDAPLRPNAELDFAVRAAERERLAIEWRADHPGSTAAVLRPATPVAEDGEGWLALGLQAAASVRAASDDDPPAQFLHLDDLAAAIALASRERLDGPFNVAPDGWIPGERVAALTGRPRLRLPQRMARRVLRLLGRLGASAATHGLHAYTVHPWVIANDRLRGHGWKPAHTNEEALVAGSHPMPWATVSPQRRQELALGAVGLGLAGLVAGAVLLIRNRLRGQHRRDG